MVEMLRNAAVTLAAINSIPIKRLMGRYHKRLYPMLRIFFDIDWLRKTVVPKEFVFNDVSLHPHGPADLRNIFSDK
jgi:hypothetical protein